MYAVLLDCLKFSFMEPVVLWLQGSVYQKVKPQIEIKPDIREKFWQKDQVSWSLHMNLLALFDSKLIVGELCS